MDFNLADLWERVVDTVADAEAMVCGERRFTYAQSDERINRLAHHLAASGIGPGDHVAQRGGEVFAGILDEGVAQACQDGRQRLAQAVLKHQVGAALQLDQDVVDDLFLQFSAQFSGLRREVGHALLARGEVLPGGEPAEMRPQEAVAVRRVRVLRAVRVGVVVAVPGGLIVPVLRDADAKGVPDIAAEVRESAGRGCFVQINTDRTATVCYRDCSTGINFGTSAGPVPR